MEYHEDDDTIFEMAQSNMKVDKSLFQQKLNKIK